MVVVGGEGWECGRPTRGVRCVFEGPAARLPGSASSPGGNQACKLRPGCRDPGCKKKARWSLALQLHPSPTARPPAARMLKGERARTCRAAARWCPR